MTELSKLKNNALSLDEFTVAIRASWNKAIESIIETAQMVKRAEEQLDRTSLNALKKRLQQDRVMSGPTFSKLAKIASNPALTSPENMPRLPTSYAALYEIAQHDAEFVQDALDTGKIHAAIRNKDLPNVLPEKPRNKLVMKSARNKISVSVRFTAEEDEIPPDLLQRLHDVLLEISEYATVKKSGVGE